MRMPPDLDLRKIFCELVLLLSLFGNNALHAQVVWSGGGSDSNWSSDDNWAGGAAPANPYSGAISFSDAGVDTPNIVDQDWTVRYLRYTNVSGFYQCFDTVSFPVNAEYASRTNRGWIVNLGQIKAPADADQLGGFARLTNQVGYAQYPYCPSGIGALEFKYRNENGKNPPAAALELLVSPDAETWTTIAAIQNILTTNTTWDRFVTNLSDAANCYARVLNVSSESKLDVGALDVRFLTPARQITDLAGHSLTVANGDMQVGDDGSRNGQINHSLATIRNGELRLGSDGNPSDLRVGHMTAALQRYGERRGNELAVEAAFNSVNLRSVYVGYGAYSSGTEVRQYANGKLDLSQATLKSGALDHRLTAENLYVGVGNAASFGRGRLVLPSTLKRISVDNFFVGRDGNDNATGWSHGEVDFGAGSQLEELRVKKWLNLGSGAYAVFENWPERVNVIIGESGAPGKAWIGAGNARWANHRYGFGASLTVSNAIFGGYIDELYIGVPMDYNENNAITGFLNLAFATIQTDGSDHSLSVSKIRIAGTTMSIDNSLQPNFSSGTLQLPAGLTNIACDVLQLGANMSAIGRLELAPNSQLKKILVREEYVFARNGSQAFLTGLPEGVDFQIGFPGAPASLLSIAGQARDASRGGSTLQPGGDLVITSGIFSAYVDELEIGRSYYTGGGNFTLRGMLNISNMALKAFDVTGNATIGQGMTAATYKNTHGELHMGAGIMNIGGDLKLGYQKRASDDSLGYLMLRGTIVKIAGRFDGWDTALVETYLAGSSAGIDLGSSAAEALSLSNGAIVKLIFQGEPIDKGKPYWGLRWAGNHVAELTNFLNAGNIVCNTAALPPNLAGKVGIWYEPSHNYTFIGMPAIPGGAVIQLR